MHYIVFKTREEPHNLSTVHRLCAILHTGMHYFAYDGEAAMWFQARKAWNAASSCRPSR
jgi:hypothetical protein